MKFKNDYLSFRNPIHIVWRDGSPEDPYVDRMDITKVVNQRIVLLEIPEKLYGARISDMVEINRDRFIKNKLEENEYFVDYSNGFIYFHEAREAETITIMYKGRGMLLYPATRIITNEGTDTETSLQTFVEHITEQIIFLKDSTEEFNDLANKLIISIDDAKLATDLANQATQDAIDATALVNNAHETTKIIYKPFVQTEDEIEQLYPNPEVGWAVQVKETGVRYRWNGKDWIPIDILGGQLPLASELVDGLMSKEDYKLLHDISLNVNTRAFVFIIPQTINVGEQLPHIESPFKGKIKKIYCSVTGKGTNNTVLRVKKSSDFINYTSVTNTNIVIPANQHRDNQQHIITLPDVKAGDIFKVEVINTLDSKNLSLNIEIEEE